MRIFRTCLCALPALVAGCTAKLSSSLPTSAPAASYVGAQAGVFAAPMLEEGIEQLQDDLERIARRAKPVPAQLSREGDVLKLRLGAEESFGAASAQLRPAALEVYAQLADVLKQRSGTVAHILVHGDETSEEPSTGLSARRAASVQSYLASRGVPGTRLRAEGRVAAQPLAPDDAAASRRVELWLVPIVAGSEAQAWVPPS